MTELREELLWVGSQRSFDSPSRGFLVAAPVVVRRVIVEAPPTVSDSDPFARAVVNLATAGVQRITDIAELIGIEDIRFIDEVVRRLKEKNLVKVVNGLVAVVGDDDVHEDVVGTRHVWYVIQDTYSGQLWPRVATRILKPEFDDKRRYVELGNPGRPAKRPFWRTPKGDVVGEPDSATVKRAVLRHLADLRTVGIRRDREEAQHLATLGRPERRPIFSARLASGREDARVLVMLNASANNITATDPFGVGAWFEFAHWTEMLLDRSPALRDKVTAWAKRNGRNQDGRVAALGNDEPADLSAPAAVPVAPTKSRSAVPTPAADRNSLLLSLADRLRAGIARAVEKSPALTYDAARDGAAMQRRWAALGFTVPDESSRFIPALVERAAEGFPADLQDLFFAWTLLVDTVEGQALAGQVPNLPSLVCDNAAGRTRSAMPELRAIAAEPYNVIMESR